MTTSHCKVFSLNVLKARLVSKRGGTIQMLCLSTALKIQARAQARCCVAPPPGRRHSWPRPPRGHRFLKSRGAPLYSMKGSLIISMRSKMTYCLPCSPGSSPTYSGRLLPYRARCSASGASAVAIDNKIEQAMDLVKSHLMYAVREEVEVLKEQIKELYERNSLLERENAVLKSLANTEQLTQLSTSPPQTPLSTVLQGGGTLVTLPPHPNVSTA